MDSLDNIVYVIGAIVAALLGAIKGYQLYKSKKNEDNENTGQV